ncbi:homocysteine S-methyltransferase 1-like [Cucurbita pepo subsp. pepo]|uniref:homocysteine S-methyltransferase 1-like n=1 Tax=Cucurbita pepo subsp. pepo TaxID=3664 RepID=UPI000C9D5675|nr:homocysteine S-methyltransferase 1-like [Cucurbita pepo subsp. pepo]
MEVSLRSLRNTALSLTIHFGAPFASSVHLEYLEAGINILVSSSYQELSMEEGELLLEKSVKMEARDSFWDSVKSIPGHNYNRALLQHPLEAMLKDFHRRRLQILVDASPDLLAFETIPNKLEAQLTNKHIVVYPNSGEVWDGRAKKWLPSNCFVDDKFESFSSRWRDLGAKFIGGCCRTTPSTILAISKVWKESSH